MTNLVPTAPVDPFELAERICRSQLIPSAYRGKPADAAKFAMTASSCGTVAGWSFRLVHEPDPVLAADVQWLSGYRNLWHDRPQVSGPLREVFAWPTGVSSLRMAWSSVIRWLALSRRWLARRSQSSDVGACRGRRDASAWRISSIDSPRAGTP